MAALQASPSVAEQALVVVPALVELPLLCLFALLHHRHFLSAGQALAGGYTSPAPGAGLDRSSGKPAVGR
ncbi:MAG: hypothetical protein WBQ41_12190 [Solirubrobacterales bacterium]